MSSISVFFSICLTVNMYASASASGDRFGSVAVYSLHSHLFDEGYKAHVRPVNDSARPTVVWVALTLVALEDVDVKGQRMKQSVFLEISWRVSFERRNEMRAVRSDHKAGRQ